jgi:hypothetical protein
LSFFALDISKAARAEEVNFFLSPEWYLIEKDQHAPEDTIVFRQYGFGPSAKKLVNIHMYVCQLRHKNHLTIRIPKEYRLQGISSESWFPETSVHANTHADGYGFSGEVTVTKGDAEAFVDSDEVTDKDFSKIFDSKTLTWAIGPEHAQVKITYVQDEKSLKLFRRTVRDALKAKALKAEPMDFHKALDRCRQFKRIAASGTEQNPRSWKATADVSTGGAGFGLELGTFRKKADCLKALEAFEKSFRSAGFEKIDALCIPSDEQPTQERPPAQVFMRDEDGLVIIGTGLSECLALRAQHRAECYATDPRDDAATRPIDLKDYAPQP